MEYIKFFANKVKHLKLLTLEEKGELLDAMIAYAFDGREPELRTNAKYIWPAIQEMLDQNKEAYDRLAENGKRTAEKRWGAKTDSTPIADDSSTIAEPLQTDSAPIADDSKTDKKQELRIKKQELRTKNNPPSEGESGAHAPAPAPAKGFVPPTVDEAAAFFEANKGNRNQAEEFINYFEASGWIRNRGVPIKDWRAAARNWIKRDPDFRQRGRASPVKAVPEQLYSQRDYGSGNIVPDEWLTEVAQ